MNISSSNVHPSSNPTPKRRQSLFSYLKSESYDVSASDARNLLLVVATLIATVTFQIGVNPPGGVWQDNNNGHQAGTAIYAPLKYNITELKAQGVSIRSHNLKKVTYFSFLLCNTFTLSASLVMILTLTSKFPLRVWTYLATVGMVATYIASIYAVTPDDYTTNTLYSLIGLCPFGFWAIDQVFCFFENGY